MRCADGVTPRRECDPVRWRPRRVPPRLGRLRRALVVDMVGVEQVDHRLLLTLDATPAERGASVAAISPAAWPGSWSCRRCLAAVGNVGSRDENRSSPRLVSTHEAVSPGCGVPGADRAARDRRDSCRLVVMATTTASATCCGRSCPPDAASSPTRTCTPRPQVTEPIGSSSSGTWRRRRADPHRRRRPARGQRWPLRRLGSVRVGRQRRLAGLPGVQPLPLRRHHRGRPRAGCRGTHPPSRPHRRRRRRHQPSLPGGRRLRTAAARARSAGGDPADRRADRRLAEKDPPPGRRGRARAYRRGDRAELLSSRSPKPSTTRTCTDSGPSP